MDESNTPTFISKIYGDFESRVKTASKRTFDGHEGGRLSSTFKSSGNLLSGLGSIQKDAGIRGRLNFDSPRKRKTSGDPLTGLERYPKAIKSEDTIQFQAEIQRLKMQLIQKEADIVSLGAEVQQEQAHLKKMELEVSRDKLLREKERESLIRQNRIDKENIQDLERKIIHLNRRQINKHQYEHMKQLKSAHQDTSEHQNEVERLSDEMTQLRDENYELRADFEQKEIDYRKSIQEFESKNSELEERLSILNQEPKDDSQQKIVIEKIQGELDNARQEIKKLECDLKLSEEDRMQHRLMKGKLDNYNRMEKTIESLRIENKLLNDTADNSQLLKEQVTDLKQKLSKAELSLDESRQKQESLFFSERQLKQWKSLCYRLLSTSERAELGNDFGPDILGSKISALQQEVLAKVDEIENGKTVMTELEHQLKSLHESIDDLNKKSEVDKQNLTEQANLIKRFKRKLLLVSKERDSYKGVLESYEHELTFTGAAFEKDRVTALEASLKDYKDTVERLEELLSNARSKEQIEAENQLRQEVSALKNQIKELQEEKIALPVEEADDKNSKVFHFLNNPLKQATEARAKEFDELKVENNALKARVQLLEEGQTKDLTLLVGQKVDEGASSEEVKELKNQLKAAEIRKQRLIEAFKKTSATFREVSYRLTGFRIDGLPDGKYRLSPVYAESPDEYLLFQHNEENGDCNLLETEYSSLDHVQSFIQKHLHHQNSIPVFLAAVITDMFSRQTFDTLDDPTSSPPAEDEEVQPEIEMEDEYHVEDPEVVVGHEEDMVGEEEELVEEEILEDEEEDIEEEEEEGGESGDDDNAGDSDASSDIVCID